MSQSSPSSPQNDRPPTVDDDAPIGSLTLLRGSLKAWSGEIQKLAPDMPIDRFSAVVVACVARTPRLLECTRYSIRQSILAAAELGLEVGGVSGEAYLVPYNTKKKLPNGGEIWVTESQFIAGYKGYMRLASESKQFRKIEAEVILPDDTWNDIERGPEGLKWGHIQREPKAAHMMTIQREEWRNREKVKADCEVPRLRGVYAYARPNEARDDDYVTVIWLPRLEAIRTRSKAGYDGPWITDYHEMARKTAVRALWKKLPKNDRMRKLEEHDQELVVPELRERDVATVLEPSANQPKDRVAAKAQAVADRIHERNAQAKALPPSEPRRDVPPQPTVEIDPETGEVVPPARGES